MTSKICTKCGQPKPLSEFNTRPGKPGSVWYRSECRTCEYARHRASAKAWYAANAERQKAAIKKQRHAKKLLRMQRKAAARQESKGP